VKLASLNWPSKVPRLLGMGRPCPRCSSVEFRAAVPEPADRLLAMFFLQPIRCVNCWRKYYSLHKSPAV
jgi:hypothetical protein